MQGFPAELRGFRTTRLNDLEVISTAGGGGTKRSAKILERNDQVIGNGVGF